jgi:hypothetical protein
MRGMSPHESPVYACRRRALPEVSAHRGGMCPRSVREEATSTAELLGGVQQDST